MFNSVIWSQLKWKEKLGSYAMKGVAAGAHLPTPRLFEPAKRPDDTADYCLEPTTTKERKKVVFFFDFPVFFLILTEIFFSILS